MKTFKKGLFLLLICVFAFPSTLVFASNDLGWPVDIEAESTKTTDTDKVNEEAVPTEDVKDTTTTSTNETLSPIDDGTVSTQDKAIFGEDYDLVNRLSNGAEEGSELSMSQEIYSNYSDVIPVVTTDQMVEWILRKGNELISIMQVFAQPFAIIIFIFSAAICLIGSLTKGNMASKGLMGMILSAILYTAVLYAPLLVNTVTGFMGS